MRTISFAVSQIVALGLVGIACAQTAERPSIKVGDTWTFKQVDKSDGQKTTTAQLQVVAVDSDKIQMRRHLVEAQSSQDLEFTADLNYVTDGIGRDTPSSIRFAWPLSVGQVVPVDYAYTSGTGFAGRIAGKCSVAGTEKVKLQAGEFDAFKIDCRLNQNVTTPNAWYGRYNETLWYAPAARNVVKLEREIRGNNTWISIYREMSAFDLKN